MCATKVLIDKKKAEKKARVKKNTNFGLSFQDRLQLIKK